MILDQRRRTSFVLTFQVNFPSKKTRLLKGYKQNKTTTTTKKKTTKQNKTKQ